MPPVACEVIVKAAIVAALSTYRPNQETADTNLLITAGHRR
jgi:hypothetical protein